MDELPEDIVKELDKLPASIRDEYFKDCLQETRFSSFKSSLYLVRQIKDIEKLQEVQEKYSRFLVYTAKEWFLSIPQIQNLQNTIIQEYLRLALSDLLSRNLIQGTEGWCYVTRHALILWPLSPVACVMKNDLYLEEDGGSECCYCVNKVPCMSKDKTRKCHKKKFCCFLEGGVHLCINHARRVFKSDESEVSLVNDRIELEDGRVVWTLKNADFMDVTGMEVEGQPKHVILNDFGEYECCHHSVYVKEEEGATEDTLLKVREELVNLQPKESFWDTI